MGVTVELELNGVSVPVTLGDAALDAIAAALADRDAARQDEWVYGDRALAAALGWPLGRVQKWSAAGRLPCHRGDGQRKTYHLPEVRAALLEDEGRRR